MEKEITGKYVISGDTIISTDEFDFNLTKKVPGVYEVIRIIDGVPLFFEKHMDRFASSAKLLGFDLKISDSSILSAIDRLVDKNSTPTGNIKIVINDFEKHSRKIYAFFIKHRYPTPDEISEGVPVILFNAERNNPNAKSTDLSIRNKINEAIKANNAYEALLVDKNNEITEGSKSNVFFLKANKIFTTPVETVLPGITREYVIDICKSLKLDLSESALRVCDIMEMDGLFLTGTSPQVLPISRVNNTSFGSAKSEIIKNIRIHYERIVNEYISSFNRR